MQFRHLFRSNNKLPAVGILLFFLLIIPLLILNLQKPQQSETKAAASWQLLGTNVPASAQSTATGKIIWALTAWNGKIYMGYGDFNANTGPIHIISYDPIANSFQDNLTTDNEAVYNFRPIVNQLFAPAIDRRATSDYAVGNTSGVWKDVLRFNSVHVFDMNTLTGSDLWLEVTRSDSQGCMYRSQDNGVSWQESMCMSVANPTYSDVRFYGIGVLNGKIYLQPRDIASNLSEVSESKSKVFDGTNWSDGPQITSSIYWRPDTFAGKILFLSWVPALSTSKTLYAFNGTSTTTVLTGVHNTYYDQPSNTYYVLLTTGAIRKTTDLTTWTNVTTAPTTARSIAVLNGDIYAGTSDSKLYVYSSSTITPPTTPTPAVPTPTSTVPTATPTQTPTPTTQPTNTPVPTATPVPNTTKFNSTVLLHGIGKGGDSVNPNGTGNASPVHPSRTLTVELHENGTDNLLFSLPGTVTFNSTNGNFTGTIDGGTSVPSGNYIVKLKSPTFLVNAYPGTLTVTSGQTLTLSPLSLVAGDANGDNQLNILDYNLLLDCYSELAPPRNCNPTKLLQTDITDDGAVNQFDYNLFLRELSIQSGR